MHICIMCILHYDPLVIYRHRLLGKSLHDVSEHRLDHLLPANYNHSCVLGWVPRNSFPSSSDLAHSFLLDLVVPVSNVGCK